ncbi:MAG: hypothetical protein HFI57_09665 [Lachnospiraceae bacterium]|nr:hypothetical protein [Lachnospiraceae bacterium]
MKYVIRLLYLLIFIGCIALVITGQHTIGPGGLGVMLLGLLGILVLLYHYNSKYQK